MLFLTLLLAHVIGDFPLQTDFLYRWKKVKSWGVLPHVLVCTIVNIFALYPLWNKIQIWIAIALLGIIHAILDRGKILISKHLRKDNLIQFLLDQFLHVLSILLISTWLSGSIVLYRCQPFGITVECNHVIRLIAIIFSVFAGVPIIYYIQNYFYQNKKTRSNTNLDFPFFSKRIPGYIERLVATSCFLAGKDWYIISILVFLPRIIFSFLKNRKLPIIGAVTGFIISILCAGSVIFFTNR
ncbi:DUF3307 domain-containing protein [candidate division KSB1 bacterium]|nr:DUF3307 domain-containing protein [candidate division KSB1 bacterium]